MVTIIKQHKKPFYESHWMIMTSTIKQLYDRYLQENPTKTVSWGTFLVLKTSYVKSTTR